MLQLENLNAWLLLQGKRLKIYKMQIMIKLYRMFILKLELESVFIYLHRGNMQ